MDKGALKLWFTYMYTYQFNHNSYQRDFHKLSLGGAIYFKLKAHWVCKQPKVSQSVGKNQTHAVFPQHTISYLIIKIFFWHFNAYFIITFCYMGFICWSYITIQGSTYNILRIWKLKIYLPAPTGTTISYCFHIV